MEKGTNPYELFAGLILDTQIPDAGDIDGFTIEECAIRAGLYEQIKVTEPCGESCICAEFGFPTACNRLTKIGQGALKKARAHPPERKR